MEKARIAVVSTDGIHVNEHFGKAERFLIYDLDDQITRVEDRDVEPLSVGDPKHAFDEDKFKRIAVLLNDCSKVFITQIGDPPAAKLKELGIEPVVYDGTIADIRK